MESAIRDLIVVHLSDVLLGIIGRGMAVEEAYLKMCNDFEPLEVQSTLLKLRYIGRIPKPPSDLVAITLSEPGTKGIDFEMKLQQCPFDHAILFFMHGGKLQFRSVNYRSIPLEVVYALHLFSEGSLNADQRKVVWHFHGKCGGVEENTKFCVFAKQPKALTKEEREGDVAVLRFALAQLFHQDASGGDPMSLSEGYGRLVRQYHSRVLVDYPIYNRCFERAMRGLHNCKPRQGHLLAGGGQEGELEPFASVSSGGPSKEPPATRNQAADLSSSSESSSEGINCIVNVVY